MKNLLSILSITIGLGLIPGCSDDDELHFVEGNIIVGFKEEVTLRQAYEFATQYSDSIGYVHGIAYYSNLPNVSLNYVASELAAAGFSNKGVRIGFVSNRIEILMSYGLNEDKSTIENWIALSEAPELKFEDMQNGKSMLLYITPGTEKQWRKNHINNPYISYIELDYYITP
jgi:hypothetical protein